jgi:hypothetical protein
MSKIMPPIGLKGKSLFSWLKTNEQQIIAAKKSVMKRFYCPVAEPEYQEHTQNGAAKTMFLNDIPEDATTIHVKVAANTSMWCDSHKDVLLRDAGKKSIRERKGMIPHIHDHKWELDSEVGDVTDIYYQDVPLLALGLPNAVGTAQALIFETDIQKEYNEKVFNKYKKGRVKQHSIGLQYVKLLLCLNDEDEGKYYENWKQYAGSVINQDAIADGYFWAVTEFKLLENSAVLLGANILTGTLETSSKSTDFEPEQSTQYQPEQVFDVSKAIAQTQFLN